jgi:hypothetical protein
MLNVKHIFQTNVLLMIQMKDALIYLLHVKNLEQKIIVKLIKIILLVIGMQLMKNVLHQLVEMHQQALLMKENVLLI